MAESWVAPLEAGDSEAAWDLFIERYRRLIFGAIRHYTAEHDEVMDVFARVCEALRADDFARLRRFAAHVDPNRPFSTWLVVVVHNLTIDWFRHRNGRKRLTQVLGIRAGGDVDARIEGNVIRRTGGACIVAIMRNDFAGQLNADIVKNDLDECYPRRAGAINVGPAIPRNPPFPAVAATGTVNIVGNTIRNTTGSCLSTSGIYYEFYAGMIERNRIDGVVQECASASDRVLPAGIWVGSLRGLSAATPVVRFNDIAGNAHAGLRVAGNITTALVASCNWWGSASGPSGAGSGTGDAVVVEAGAATPVFMPFATGPIAETVATSC